MDKDGDLVAFAEAIGNYEDIVVSAKNRSADKGHPTTSPTPGGPGREAEEPPVRSLLVNEIQESPVAPHEPPRQEPPADVDPMPDGTAIVPLTGMKMSVPEVDLGFARLVRSGGLEDQPEEVTGSEQNVFAVIDVGPSEQAPNAAAARLRQTVTTLRLLKPGGVGLGPHGWARHANGWTRFVTGAKRARGGGYALSSHDAVQLRKLSDQITERTTRTRAFGLALVRFDQANERSSQLDTLSDHLQALRTLLEGGGPAGVDLAERAAGICAGAEDRDELRSNLERAIALERKLLRGERPGPGDPTPLEAIATVEEMLRMMLCGMATGELGSDLRITADEILVADGLRAGEGSALTQGGTAEWGLAETGPSGAPMPAAEQIETPDLVSAMHEVSVEGDSEEGVGTPGVEGEPSMASDTNVETPDWLSDTLGGDRDRDLIWPQFASPRPRGQERRRASEASVKFLFPVPDATDWSIGDYGSKRSARNR